MSLQFIIGNSGSGKTEYLFNRIVKEAKAHTRDNYLVIVPEQFTMQTQRKLVDLSENKAIMNIDVLSFKRLAYRVFDELGIGTLEVLEETGKNLVLRKIAQDKADELGVMGRNMNRIGYISEVKSLLSELVQYNIKPDDLRGYIESGRLSESLCGKLKDVLVMYDEFEKFMQERYITAEEILNVLCDVAHESAILKNAVIAFDEFTGFTPIQNQLMKKLFVISQKIYVTLTIDSREDMYHSRGMHELFDMPKKTIRSLMDMADFLKVPVEEPVILEENYRLKDKKELLFMEQNLFRKKRAIYTEDMKTIHIDSLRDPKQELTLAARRISELVRKQGLKYRDIAVVTGDVSAYDNYVESIFAKYNIPYFIDTTQEILFHPFIEFIRSIPDIESQNYSAESVLRFLRCGFTELSRQDIDVLENYLLATGIRGKGAWDKLWTRIPRQKSAYDLDKINEQREYIAGLLSPVYAAFHDKSSTVRDFCISIYELTAKLEVGVKLAAKEQEFLDSGMQTRSKEYGQIYKIVMQLFEKYIALLGDEHMKTEEFVEILDAGLDAAEVAVIPPGYDTVTIGDIERTRLSDIKVMFFIGVNDGIVPKAASRGGIISQYERETLKEMDIELAPGAREQSFIQRFYLYLSMTKPARELFISYSRLDGDGKAAQPSYLIGVLKNMFPKLSVNEIEDVEQIADLTSEQSALDYLLCADIDDKWCEIAAALYKSGVSTKNAIDRIIEARYEHYSKDAISKNIAKSIYGRHMVGSITRFEQFARCAYAHFLNYGLRLSEREESGFTTLDMGNIYHEALEKYSKKLDHTQDDWFSVSDEKRDELASEAIGETIDEYSGYGIFDTAQDSHTVERMKNIFRQTVWALTTQIRKGSFVPERFEFSFFESLDMEGDVQVDIKGRVDRTDTYTDDGRMFIKVLDYKSGNTAFDLVKLYYGTQLQLAVYMDAVMEQKKQTNTSVSVEPGGMLYYHIDDPVIDLTDISPDETLSEEEIDRMILRMLKPDGLINSDEKAYRGMDADFEKDSDVIPVKLKKDQTPDAYSKVASKEEFEVITEFARNKLREIGKDIYNGAVEVNPIKTKKIDSCAFCGYQSICRFGSKIPGFSARSFKGGKKDDVIEHMRNENAVADFRAGYGSKNMNENSVSMDNMVTNNNDTEGSR
ncbi:PD-(D/E)XK nuclease family protein [Agathobacter sp.]